MALRRPPGPKPHFLIGNLAMLDRSPLTTIRRWAEEYDDMFYYRAGWVHVYYFNHPDFIEYVLVRNPQNFVRGRVSSKARWLLGNGLVTSEGEHWKRQRRLSQPGFTRERIEAYSHTMTECAEQMLATWKPGEVIDVHEEMMDVALRVVMWALFDLETAETEVISRSLNTIMENSSGVRLVLPATLRFLIPGMRQVNQSIARMNTAVYDIIRQRRQNVQAHSRSLLSFLMAARDEDGSQMTDEQLRDEIMTFLVGGHETSALALSWTLHLIAGSSEVEQKLHEEVDRALGGRTPTMSDIPGLRFTEAVLKEGMRLYPPLWSTARTPLQDFELGGYTIPRGANIVMSQWLMHHNPRYYPEPDRFDPERWLRNTTEKLPKLAYFPFGAGQRQCIGGSFAMAETVLTLAAIAQKFRLITMPDPPVVPDPGFTLRPKYGIKMRIEARSAGSN